MDKETIGSLLVGGSVAAAISYILHIFTKRDDKADVMEERIRQLELSHRDLMHIRDKQAEVDQKIDNLLEVMTLIRIQLNVVLQRENDHG